MRYYCLTLFLILSVIGFAQINKNGLPIITNYTPEIYQASEQNWAIVQDHRGVMYFGNNDYGVLEFDGLHWRKIPISNKSIVRSLAVGSDGTIFVGAVDEIGFIQPNNQGQMVYHSLVELIDASNHKFSNVWKTYVIHNTVYFCTEKIIFSYQKGKIDAYQLPKNSFYTFQIDSSLYLCDFLEGLKKFNGSDFFLVKNGDFFAHKGIFTLHKYNDTALLAGTFPDGIFIYSFNGTVDNKSWSSKANNFLIKNQLYQGIRSVQGNYAFSTLNSGLLITENDGTIRHIINKATGLQDETVISCFESANEDASKIWLALNSGISKIETGIPIQKFGEAQGLQGAVNDICSFNNTLYLGTSLGVYYLDFTDENLPVFKQIEGISDQVWSLLVRKDKNGQETKLLVGSIVGLFAIDKQNKVTDIDYQIQRKEEPGLKNYITKLYASTSDSNEIFVGKINAMFTIRESNSVWHREKIFTEIKDEVRNIIEDLDGNVWVGTYFNGIYKISYDKNVPEYLHLGQNEGLPSIKDVFIQEIDGRVVFGTEKGLYTFNEASQKFVRDTLFCKSYTDGSMGIFRIKKDIKQNYWISGFNQKKRWIERGYYDTTGVYLRDTLPFKRLPNEQIDAIYNDKNEITWLGSSSGLYSYNPALKQNFLKPYNALIRQVTTVNDSVLFGGTFYHTNQNGDTLVSLSQPKSLIPSLDYQYNDLSFEFAAPYFIDEKKTQYSYLLEGFKDTWSKWNTEPKAVFTNLREGDYTFKVKAKNIYGIESQIASYQFTILSPWYRTVLAYVIYALLVLLAVIAIVKLYTRKLEQEKITLEGIVQERTAEIRCQKEDIERKNEILNKQKTEIEAQAIHLSRANKVLHEQKEEIFKQKEEITASIKYAKRIQTAIVPSEEDATRLLKDYFLLWRPRDIVSGDFWWMGEKNNQVIIAAADCTGHGVPGAFMSMLGVSFLNEIVNQQDNTLSHEILNKLRHKVKTTLGQTGKDGEAKDGMDIALMVVDFDKRILQYSGAYNPMYLYRNNELIEYKADRNPIGIYIKEKDSFTQNVVELMPGDTLYIFSDGYVDQFGGADQMKFTSKRFKELLGNIQAESMQSQKEILNNTIDAWRGNTEQIDDIIVLGLRIL